MRKKTLLIGAGFTKNFGGYLAEDILLEIFNHPLSDSKIKELIIQYEDFEVFYDNAINGNEIYEAEKEKDIIRKILMDIYKKMDNVLQHNIKMPLTNFSYLKVINFILSFSFANGSSGYIFSLNQDVLLERLFTDYLKQLHFYLPGGWNEHQGILLPHYGPIDSPFYKYHYNDPRGNLSYMMYDAITKDTFQKWESRHEKTYESSHQNVPCLLKLHGSYYWRNQDETGIWIVGQDKERMMQKYPIVKAYFDKFSKVLNNPHLDIYIMGYSFRDEHINRVIFNACCAGSQLYIFDILDFKNILDRINEAARKCKFEFKTAWISQYHKKPFSMLFPHFMDNELTHRFNKKDESDAIASLKQMIISDYMKA